MFMNFEKTNAPIKRGQVVLLTSESIAFPGKGEGMGYEEYFDDVNKPYTAWSVGNLVENGILNGYPDGTFKPNNNITRAEVAAIINNLISVGETGFYFRAD